MVRWCCVVVFVLVVVLLLVVAAVVVVFVAVVVFVVVCVGRFSGARSKRILRQPWASGALRESGRQDTLVWIQPRHKVDRQNAHVFDVHFCSHVVLSLIHI
eukprot:2666438-Rhodomonas_salina.1